MQRGAESKGGGAKAETENEDDYKLYVKNLDTGEDVAVSETVRGFTNFSVAEAKDVHVSDLLPSKDGDDDEGFRSDDDE
jgi:ribosomal protein L7/L12